MDPIASLVDDPSVVFNFPEPEKLKPADPDARPCRGRLTRRGQPVLRGLNLRLDPDDRVALLGANATASRPWQSSSLAASSRSPAI